MRASQESILNSGYLNVSKANGDSTPGSRMSISLTAGRDTESGAASSGTFVFLRCFTSLCRRLKEGERGSCLSGLTFDHLFPSCYFASFQICRYGNKRAGKFDSDDR